MTVKICLVRSASRSDIGDSLQITFGQPEGSDESITLSSANQVSSIAATSTQQIWEIYPPDDCLAAFGKTPNATGALRRPVPGGVRSYYGVREVGEKVAVVAAS